MVEGHVLLLHFLTYEADVGLALKCALECDMACRASHHLYEVPILACRVAVALDVTDKFRISLACSVETERSLYLLVLKVAVDSFWATNNLNAVVLGSIIFCKNACVGV